MTRFPLPTALLTAVSGLLARWPLRGCASVGEGTRVLGKVWIHGEGRIVLGNRVVLDGSKVPIELHAKPGAQLVLGDDVRIEGGASIEAVQSVVVKKGAVLRAFCKILDNHFHPLKGDRHERPSSEPVVIGEGSEIGVRAIVLPGADIGARARIGPGVVISRRVPNGVSLVGMPPKVERATTPS